MTTTDREMSNLVSISPAQIARARAYIGRRRAVLAILAVSALAFVAHRVERELLARECDRMVTSSSSSPLPRAYADVGGRGGSVPVVPRADGGLRVAEDCPGTVMDLCAELQ